jgi:hypothetical protein
MSPGSQIAMLSTTRCGVRTAKAVSATGTRAAAPCRLCSETADRGDVLVPLSRIVPTTGGVSPATVLGRTSTCRPTGNMPSVWASRPAAGVRSAPPRRGADDYCHRAASKRYRRPFGQSTFVCWAGRAERPAARQGASAPASGLEARPIRTGRPPPTAGGSHSASRCGGRRPPDLKASSTGFPRLRTPGRRRRGGFRRRRRRPAG